MTEKVVRLSILKKTFTLKWYYLIGGPIERILYIGYLRMNIRGTSVLTWLLVAAMHSHCVMVKFLKT